MVWSGVHIYGQRFSSAGLSQGGEFQISSSTLIQLYPAISHDAAGNFVVVWQSNSQDGQFGGIFAHMFDSSGLALGSEFQVNQTTLERQAKPAVSHGTQGFVVAWQSYDQDGDRYGIFARGFSSSATPLTSEFQVNSYTTSQQGLASLSHDSGDNFVVVWSSSGQGGSGYGPFGRTFFHLITTGPGPGGASLARLHKHN